MQNKNQINYLHNKIYNKYTAINGSFFSHKSSVSIDLNLPPLPDARKHSTMICEIPNDFFLPDGKNTQLSKIVNTWTFDRLTPNGNELVLELNCFNLISYRPSTSTGCKVSIDIICR